MTTFDVCVVGSANLDLVAGAARIPRPGETVLGHTYAEHPGGKGLNQAVSSARSGARTTFVGAVGDDAAGATLREVLAGDQIDDGALRVVADPTGRALIVVDDTGENSIVVVPGANAHVAIEALPASRVVLVQLEIPIATVEAALRVARRRGSVTILNPAPAPTALTAALIEQCDLVVPNEHEVELLGGVDALLAAGCRTVVVTRGGRGVDVHGPDGTAHVPAFGVDVVDTTGAGDAFCGALASRVAAGDDLADAVRWAAAAGALATTVHGAVPAQPTATRVRELLDRR